MGDLKSRRTDRIGPFEINLDSGERDSNGILVMEEFTDPIDGQVKNRPKLDPVPFLKQVYFKRNHYTLKFEETLKQLKEGNNRSSLEVAMINLEAIISDWDLTDDGKKVPPTFKGMKDHDVDADIVFSILSKYNQVTRPPLEQSEKSPNTSSQKESMDESLENTD